MVKNLLLGSTCYNQLKQTHRKKSSAFLSYLFNFFSDSWDEDERTCALPLGWVGSGLACQAFALCSVFLVSE